MSPPNIWFSFLGALSTLPIFVRQQWKIMMPSLLTIIQRLSSKHIHGVLGRCLLQLATMLQCYNNLREPSYSWAIYGLKGVGCNHTVIFLINHCYPPLCSMVAPLQHCVKLCSTSSVPPEGNGIFRYQCLSWEHPCWSLSYWFLCLALLPELLLHQWYRKKKIIMPKPSSKAPEKWNWIMTRYKNLTRAILPSS